MLKRIYKCKAHVPYLEGSCDGSTDGDSDGNELTGDELGAAEVGWKEGDTLGA